MKFGSVDFFKMMIKACLLILPICLVLLIVVSIWFAVYHKNTSEHIEALESRIEQLEADAAMQADVSLSAQSGSFDQGISEQIQFEKPVSDKNNNYSTIEQSKNNHSVEAISPGFEYLPDFWLPLPEAARLPENKTVYLTFDDGPSPVTLDILDTLDEYGIKATFFVVSRRHDYEMDILREVAARGHSIGMHSDSHDPTKIYLSKEDYLADMYENFKYVYEVTGIKPQIFRFVGGSNSKYNKHAATEIITAMTDRGFSYFDWNSSADDALKPHPSASRIISNVLRTAETQQLIVLAHDSGARTQTAAALPELIETLQARGFVFNKLDASVEPIRFLVP